MDFIYFSTRNRIKTKDYQMDDIGQRSDSLLAINIFQHPLKTIPYQTDFNGRTISLLFKRSVEVAILRDSKSQESVD